MITRSGDRAHWYEQASRWTQLTFVEDDPLHFDIDAWRDIMVRTHSNAICLSAGGYIAFYPSKVPHHYISAHLGNRDLFGEVVDVARSLGMKVMARVDPHAIHQDAAQAHPEWLARRPDGSPVEHPSFSNIWLTCPHSTYHSDFLTDVATEVVREYNVDAVFANRWEGPQGVSYSEAARESFHRATGLELPVKEPAAHPIWREHAAWRGRRLSSLIATWDAAVRSVNPDSRFIPNRGPFQLRTLDPEIIDRATPAFFIDKQGRWDKEAIWAAGRVGKRSKGTYPDRPVNLITSVGPEHHQHRWKDSVDSPAELVTAIADGILHEANPWFTKFNARIVDDRWIEPVARAFGLHKKIEAHYLSSVARPEVVILENVAVDESNLLAAYASTFDEEDGFYQALLEARIPFGFVPDFRLSRERLEGVRLVILPDAQTLSDAQVAVLKEFVEGGGSLIATDRTSLLDKDGKPRADYALAEVLGITLTGVRRDPVKNNYVAITEPHPVASGFEGAERIIGGTALSSIDVAPDARVPFRFVSDFPDLPMEEVYPREEASQPAIVCHENTAGGRTVYAAFNLGATYWDALQQDHARLIVNTIDWALHGQRRVRVEGFGLTDVAVRELEGGLLVGLVNLDNSMAMRGQLHWLRPLDAQTLRVQAPDGVAEAQVRLLIAEAGLPATVTDGELVVELPPTDLMEVVEILWRPESATASTSKE